MGCASSTDRNAAQGSQRRAQLSRYNSRRSRVELFRSARDPGPGSERVGNFNFVTQQAEKDWFLSCAPEIGISAQDLLPGDILVHKDYGDTGEDLYKMLTRMALFGKVIRLAKDKLRKEADVNPRAISPFSLHPYIYVGKVHAPEGFDPEDDTEAPVPAVAQSSRFYPCDGSSEDGDAKCAGVRRRKLSSLTGESLLVWRFKDPVARQRICAVALALTNPAACRYARQQLKWAHSRPLIPYSRWTAVKSINLGLQCIHAQMWCDMDSDMASSESVLCEKAYRIISALADTICSAAEPGECHPEEIESNIAKHHQLVLLSAAQLVQITNDAGLDYEGLTCAEFATCAMYAAFPYPKKGTFPRGIPGEAALKYWKISPVALDEYFLNFGQPDDPDSTVEMFVLNNDYVKHWCNFVPSAKLSCKSTVTIKLYAGEPANELCVVSGCRLPHRAGELYCQKHERNLETMWVGGGRG